MADYQAKSKYTRQQIDNYLNIARLSSNPNLLDNWYFGNPVNQRGQTSYSGKGYTIDRWMNEHSDRVVATLENGLLKLTLSGLTTYMQRLQAPVGIKVTCSVLVENIDGDLYLLFQETDSYADTHALKLSEGINTITVTTTKQNYRFCIYSETASSKTVGLKAAKLELGDQQTLAHQDTNGNWVLNEIPDYTTEYLKCKRYYRRCGFGLYVTSQATNTFVINFPFDVPMRTAPVANFIRTDFKLYSAMATNPSITVTDANMIVKQLSENGVRAIGFTGTLSAAFEDKMLYRVNSDYDFIELSADL